MQVNAADYDNFDDYCAALRRCKTLTPSEYRCLLQQSIAWGEESYFEADTQYRSECAMFGDAGPGQAQGRQDIHNLLAQDRKRLARVDRIIANTCTE